MTVEDLTILKDDHHMVNFMGQPRDFTALEAVYRTCEHLQGLLEVPKLLEDIKTMQDLSRSECALKKWA